MDDLARARFADSAAVPGRSASLDRLRILDAGRWHAPLAGRSAARFIAVRGRSGVGKSTIVANLAIALARLRSRVVVIDLDLRRPTLHELFGVATPVQGLKALLNEQIDTMEQALTPTMVRNLFLVSADGTAPRAQPANAEQQHRLLEQIWDLDADIVIADIGTDLGDDLVDLFALGALRLVVSSPDARALRRTYDLFREEVLREIEHVAGGTAEGASLVAGLAHPQPEKMADLLAHARAKPNLHAALEQALHAFGGRIVGNRARNSNEADLMHAASRLIADYLGIAVPVLGVVEASASIDATRASGRPLLIGSGIDRNVRLFHSMAEQLLMDNADAEAARCISRPAPSVDLTSGATIQPSTAPDADGSPLPASLGGYLRRYPRHHVDWHALFRSDSGPQTAVRVFEISLTGASIETLPGLDVGDHGRLIFTQISGQPEVQVTVMDARRPLGRAGLRFDESNDVCSRLVALATATSGGSPTQD